MAPKPSEVIQYKIRIRQDLRKRLEQAAKKRDVSINYEMTSRLKESFDREALVTIYRVSEDIKTNWAKYGKAFFHHEHQDDLVQATKALVAVLAKSTSVDSEGVRKAINQVEKALIVIDLTAQAAGRGTTGGE